MFIKCFKNIDLDSPGVTGLHRQIIRDNVYLHHWYKKQYNKYRKMISGQKNGRHIELGSGGGFIKEMLPFVTTSSLLQDDVTNGFADIVLDAEKMNLENSSVESFFLLDTFHHIKHPSAFFPEVDRCLKKNGYLLMIEPAATIFSRYLYKNFHHEVFDDTASLWDNEKNGHLSSSNQALGYNVFERDYETFTKRFPSLAVQRIKKHTFISYIVSGGLSYRSFLPETSRIAGGMIKTIDAFEFILSPVMGVLGTYMDIYIQKNR